MANDDILTVTVATALVALPSTAITIYQLSKGSFNGRATWLMAKVLLATVGTAALTGCAFGDTCTKNEDLKALALFVGIPAFMLSAIVVPLLGGGLIGQALGWVLWRIWTAITRR
jgi:hypothetical protein